MKKLYTSAFAYAIARRNFRAREGCGCRLAIAAISISLSCLAASAANHYIRAGATGANNGSSWADAWTNFASVTWTRGDVYYLAGGNYLGDVTISRALSGNLWIRIKKANPADNAGDTGWLPSFATEQAVINGRLFLANGYTELDGVTGSGTNGHGIKIVARTTVVLLGNNQSPFHIYHVEAQGPGYAYSTNAIDVLANNNITTPQKGLHIANCWLHEVTRNGITVGGLEGTSYDDYGLLFENNVISETGGCPDRNVHGQGMQISYGSGDRFTIIRNNVFQNISGTGMIVWLGGNNSVHRDARVYNNVFRLTVVSTNGLSPGVIYAHNAATATYNISVYNNTFYGIGLPSFRTTLAQIALDTAGTTNNVLVNNLWENCYFSAVHRGFDTQSNNGYFGNTGSGIPTGTLNQINGTSTTLVNPEAGDFHLLTKGYARGAGLNLSSIFGTDFDGRARQGKWDIGAFSLLVPRPPPSAPSFGTP